ncbi:hypothetical protein LBMAG56_22760 [Verrucomicrobiota bacterium]|nr:hypothetical protein LBMAG56_22760 [Verrucomicrobiota bacterium]
MLTVAENSPGATLALMNDIREEWLLWHPDYRGRTYPVETEVETTETRWTQRKTGGMGGESTKSSISERLSISDSLVFSVFIGSLWSKSIGLIEQLRLRACFKSGGPPVDDPPPVLRWGK